MHNCLHRETNPIKKAALSSKHSVAFFVTHNCMDNNNYMDKGVYMDKGDCIDKGDCMDKMLSNSLGVCRQVIGTAERPSIDYLQLITSVKRPPA